MESAKEILEKENISPSIHRIKILEYIMINKNHPTADIIYQALSSEIPTLSKTTVYNTLHMFVEKGILLTVTPEENEIRYDILKPVHAHFKCEKCEKYYDIEQSFEFLHEEMIDGHKISEHNIFLSGICRKCLPENEKGN